MSSDGYLCSVEDAVLECLDVSFGGECRAALNQHISVVVQVFQNISSEKVCQESFKLIKNGCSN